MEWNPGQRLFGGRYFIERKLGEGGVGITFLVKTQSNQLRVIKTLKAEILNNRAWKPHREKLRQDFRDEAVRLAVCRHPHIVQIENIFDENDLPCIVMEYIEGEDLGKRLKQQGILSETEALLYIRQIGNALTVIHSKGLLHRDIKPRNLMIRTGRLEAVLIDFGIAREFIPGVIQRHTVYRTPGFAPPEQYELEAPRGEYIDVYGLAATLYTLLTGVIPTSADERIRNIPLEAPKSFNPYISNKVNQAIMQGMAIQPRYRPQSVSEWLTSLGSTTGASSANVEKNSLFLPAIPISFGRLKTSPTLIAPQSKWQCIRTIAARSMIYAIAISPDGHLFASGGNDNSVKLWELETGRKIRHFGRWFSGHSDSVWSLAFSPDGQILATASWDNTIKLWQTYSGKKIRTLIAHDNGVNTLAFSPNGQLIASGSVDSLIKIIHVDTGHLIHTLKGHHDAVTAVSFSPDGNMLATASSDCTIKIWQANTGREIHTLVGHSFFVNTITFDFEGKILASGSSDKTIKLWQVLTGREIRTLTGHYDTVSSIKFSRNSHMLVSGSWDKTLKLWQVNTGEEVYNLIGHESYIRSLAITPNGKTIISGGDDDTIRIWR